MNIGNIKNLVAGLLHQVPSAFVLNGVDTLLVAINNAKKTGERVRDFYYSQMPAYLSVASTGSAITGATTAAGSGSAVIIKRIQSVQLAVSGGYIPIEFMREDEYISRLRKQIGRTPYVAGNTLASYGISSENPIAYQQGQNLFLVGTGITFPIIVKMDVVQWLPDYANDADTDFFTQFGATYLQWQAILEGNRYWQQFVTRQEGAVVEDSVTTSANQALAAFLEWDDSISKGTSSTKLPAPESTPPK